jgi:hypothetical protein
MGNKQTEQHERFLCAAPATQCGSATLHLNHRLAAASNTLP